MAPGAPRHHPLVFVDDLEDPVLADDDRHHLERSLRLRPGDPLTVGDGRGRWRAARLGPDLVVDGAIEHCPRRPHPVMVAFAPVKGDRSDLVVQKLTELGVDVVAPVTTERSVVRWDGARAARHHERHRRIAREAAMQSRNPWLPTIEAVAPLDRFLLDHPDAVLADPAGPPLRPGPRAVVIGPEGGFSAVELARRSTIGLPGHVLRTETAAITAAALLVAAAAPGPSPSPPSTARG